MRARTHTNKQINKQTDKQTNKQTNTHTHSHTHTHTRAHTHTCNTHIILYSLGKMPNCTVCGRLYLHKSVQSCHIQSHQEQQPSSTCGQCGKIFSRSGNLAKHWPQTTTTTTTTTATTTCIYSTTATAFRPPSKYTSVDLLLWIQAWRAVVNVVGTGDDCFKWAILVGMHPVEVNADHRGNVEHMGKYDFSSLSFPVPLQAVGSFALGNNMPINVNGVDDDNEGIFPFRVSSTLVPDGHVDLLLFECDGVQHYTTIRNFIRLVGRH